MRGLVYTLAIGTLALGLATPAAAQKTTEVHPGKGGSPHVRTEWTIEGANISIEYGRPYMKGRKIWGALVPYGQVWRTGADEATTLKTDATLMFGDVAVPPGTYTLYTVPTEQGGELVINKQTGQWGTEYSETQDAARVPLKREPLTSPVEQLTISIDPQAGGGMLGIAWADAKLVAPFTVEQ